MKPRVELQTILETLLGSRNVYFQPPENLKLKYPCFVYERVGIDTEKADNLAYQKHGKYSVTYIDTNPDSDIPERILELPHCSYSNHFVRDNLNHDVFTIFF